MKIGVLALQGAFIEHAQIINKLKVETLEVRLPKHLEDIDGLIIPGGESTTILKLMHDFKLFSPLKEMLKSGFPVWGTCAGMICLANKVSNSQEAFLQPLEIMDIDVRRNAFGRQVDSFEVDLIVPVLGEKPYHAVFIRAPLLDKVGPGVKVLSKLQDGTIVAAQQGFALATSFHPELTDDNRFHRYFLEIITEAKRNIKKR